MSSSHERYEGWTVVGHGHAIYLGSSGDPKSRAFFFAPPDPPNEPPPGSATEEFSGTVFEAELDAEDEQIVPLPDRNWAAETEDDLREIFEEVRDEIDPDTLSEFIGQHVPTSDSPDS